MNLEHLRLLACPACHEPLTCTQGDADAAMGTVIEGTSRLCRLPARVPGDRRRAAFRPARKLRLRIRFGVDQTRTYAIRQLLGNSCLGAAFLRSDRLAERSDRRGDSRGGQRFGPVYGAGRADRRNRRVARLQLRGGCQLCLERQRATMCSSCRPTYSPCRFGRRASIACFASACCSTRRVRRARSRRCPLC